MHFLFLHTLQPNSLNPPLAVQVHLPQPSASDVTARNSEDNNRAPVSVPGQSQINI